MINRNIRENAVSEVGDIFLRTKGFDHFAGHALNFWNWAE